MLSNHVAQNKEDLQKIATAVRCLSMDAVLKSKSGHIGLPLGGADMGTLLYFGAMNHSPANPKWLNRDRFVLSAGHGSMLQYSLLHLAGYDLPLEEIVNFRQLGSQTAGHPEFGHTAGVECTTGPLGQGISNAVGMALAERLLAARFNCKTHTLIDHRTYVILGDGCMMEGVASEACSLAGHMKLNKLIALYDANNITIDGNCDISFTENVALRFQAYGWNVLEADGNDFDSLAKSLDKSLENAQKENGTTGPTLIVCKGIPGKGSPKWEGKHKIHGNPMSAEDVQDAKKHLGVSVIEPFFLPDELRSAAQKLSKGFSSTEEQWNVKLKNARADWKANSPDKEALWNAFTLGQSAVDTNEEVQKAFRSKMATRVASGKALAHFAALNPTLVGGSADLAGSNNTTLSDSTFVTAKEFIGRNIHFGVREHGMGAVANGMALHSHLRPYCATFLVFSDYMRPTVRLAALMGIPTLFIFTHDSFGVGEDGPTHQPVEHAASLRAIPNLNVIRPADGLETLAAWKQAMSLTNKPTALLLTRQDVPDLDSMLSAPRNFEEICEGMDDGAYLLKDFTSSQANMKLVLIASGSEVSLALETAKALESQEFKTLKGEKISLAVRVISAPCPQKLASRPLALNKLVPTHIPAIAIEAGCTQGWGEIVGRTGAIFGMNRFGASAPFAKLCEHLGYTVPHLSEFSINVLGIKNA
jgi:transketolase